MPVDFDISPVIPPVSTEPAKPVVPVTPPAGVPPPITPGNLAMRTKSSKALKWLILVAIGLFAVTIASLFWGGNSFSDKNVLVTLEAVDHASSGDEITYTLKYENRTKVSLTAMSFRFFYPQDSIVLKDGKPTTPDSEGFVVDRLDPGQSGSKEFKLYLVGDKGTTKTARVHLIFTAGTLKSSFEKDVNAATIISELPINLTLVAPPTSVSGQPIQYILDVRNDTPDDLTDLKAVFKYPDGFTIQKMQPQSDEGTTTWKLDQLKAGQGTRITINGVLTGNEREVKTVTVALQHNINGNYVDDVRTSAFTMISSPLLSVSLTPNASRDYVAFAGDSLTYRVAYANNSRYSLNGLTLGVKLEGEMYNLSGLQVTNGSFDEASRTVTFNSSGVPDLGNLRPGQSGVLTFTVPLKAGLTGNTQSPFVKATARLATSNVPSGLDGSEVFAVDSVVTKISSQPSMTQSLLYDGGAGSGPLPPKVGEQTTLTVRWQIANPGNDVRNVVVTATLPPGATFQGAATATLGTTPTFNASTNKITWNVGTLPFGTGTGMARAQADFKVSFTPSSNQVGQSISIVNGTTLMGTDSFTSQAIQLQIRDASTDTIDGHADQGRVQ